MTTLLGALITLLALLVAPPVGAPPIGDLRHVFVVPERQLVPEGIAHDLGSGRFFVSSVYLAKIVAIEDDGEVTDFIASGQDGFYGGVGLKVDRRRGLLWAASGMGFQTKGFTPERDGLSGLFAFDLEDGSLRHRFQLSNDEEKHLLNDLALAADGTLYVTDTLTSRLYRVAPDLGGMHALETEGELPHPNGIALSGDESLLYVATDEGLKVVDLATRRVAAISGAEAGATRGVDGLYWHGGSLVAVQNHRGFNRVARFHLDPGDLGSLACVEILAEDHPVMELPTTGAIVDGSFYFIANSHLDSFDEDGTLLPANALTEPAIVVIGLGAGNGAERPCPSAEQEETHGREDPTETADPPRP